MNKRQKTVTLVFLILFLVSCLHAPWINRNSKGYIEYIKYGTIFKKPKKATNNYTISINIVYTWTAILISYGFFYALSSDTKKE